MKILTGSIKYQGIDGYFCNNVMSPEMLVNTNYQVISSGGWVFLQLDIMRMFINVDRFEWCRVDPHMWFSFC